ncbi:hypothetical protein PVAP13_2NG126200 [Panicum virgatum]|uniref:BHLH domain-containing protein n=1 Tax=Panicum virgatum TaxID=38727 RepID=A0A8T0VEE6_PANVG|nr:hypothetical protein PVAP13_2NG126200 [Panicum virgatum]
MAVQKALQAVAEGTGWTYSVLWKLCPHQGALVWAEGHYNGAIKTRKTTVAPGREEDQEAAAAAGRRRSRQLRDLYDSLAGEAAAAAAGGRVVAVPVARRPSAALAPEDLTETEWFYLMCASYCFPPGIGLPGEAFARRGYVWLCGANKVDSKLFSRAILARQSAGIQTVACIPVNDDDVLEIGTTEKVAEDSGLIQYARSIFMDQHGTPIMPTLSGHSTSNPSTHINHQPFQMKMEKYIGGINVQPNNPNPEDENIEMEDEDDILDSETHTENGSRRHLPLDNMGNEQARPYARSSELMQIERSESLRAGCTNHVDDEISMLMVCQNGNNIPAQYELGSWHFPYENLIISSEFLQSSAAQDQAALAENAHYIETVLTILRRNACRRAQAAALSKNSSFSSWNGNKGTNNDRQRMLISEGSPQRMLKSVLFIGAPAAGYSHQWHRREVQPPEPSRDDGEGTSRSRRGQGQAELSASHVLKERRRREKLNERFIALRSLVPFVTKMDRASILGDTIEYLKQLRRRIQELESRARLQKIDGHLTAPVVPAEKRAHQSASSAAMVETGSSRMRAVEATSSSCGGAGRPAAAASAEVQVSIIGSDALVEVRCPRRDGLLLRVMEALHRELGLEVTTVQASSAGDVLLVELRAEVREVHGRRSGINEVKRAIHLVISSD